MKQDYSCIDPRNVGASRRAIVEAREPDGGQWDSDLVGSASLSYSEAVEYLSACRDETNSDGAEWDGYSLRIVVEDEDGCYRLIVDGSEITL